MRTTLKSQGELHCITLFAELGLFERRPELGRLCQAAEREGLSEGSVEAILPGLSPAACRNLLAHVRRLGLCDEEGRLTPGGRRCARSGEAPVFEQGSYTFSVAVHPVLGPHLLHFRRERPDSRDRSTDDLVPVPDWMKVPADAVWTSALAPRQRFCLRSLITAPRVAPLCRTTALGPCQWIWELELRSGKNQRWIEGQLGAGNKGDGAVPFRADLEPLPEAQVSGLLARWEPRWDAKQSYLAMAYDGQADATEGRDSFRRNVPYPRVEVPGQGHFTAVQVLDVPVGPSDPKAAEGWAFRLHRARLLATEGYLGEAQVRALFQEVVGVEPLARFGLVEPPLAALLRSLEGRGGQEPQALSTWWRLVAPADLAGDLAT
jgi:hypothetical protein